MHYRYHCACCEKIVESTVKECTNCGSHNIRSPFGFWLMCLIACFCAAIIVKTVHIYLKNHQEAPVATSFLEILKQENKVGR